MIDSGMRVQVECVNEDCERKPKAAVVVEEVAPGILGIPAELTCKYCGQLVKRVTN